MFKKFIYTFIFVLFCIASFSQEKTPSFVDEVGVSVNRFWQFGSWDGGQMGFGVGGYHTFKKDKLISPTVGLEYNLFRNYSDYNNFGRTTYYDMNFTTHAISMPFGCRFYFNEQKLLYLESGAFADLLLSIHSKGYKTVSSPVGDPMEKSEVDLYDSGVLYGAYLSLGIRVSSGKYNIFLVPDYRLSFRSFDYSDALVSYLRLSVKVKW